MKCIYKCIDKCIDNSGGSTALSTADYLYTMQQSAWGTLVLRSYDGVQVNDRTNLGTKYKSTLLNVSSCRVLMSSETGYVEKVQNPRNLHLINSETKCTKYERGTRNIVVYIELSSPERRTGGWCWSQQHPLALGGWWVNIGTFHQQ